MIVDMCAPVTTAEIIVICDKRHITISHIYFIHIPYISYYISYISNGKPSSHIGISRDLNKTRPT